MFSTSEVGDVAPEPTLKHVCFLQPNARACVRKAWQKLRKAPRTERREGSWLPFDYTKERPGAKRGRCRRGSTVTKALGEAVKAPVCVRAYTGSGLRYSRPTHSSIPHFYTLLYTRFYFYKRSGRTNGRMGWEVGRWIDGRIG